MSNEKPQTQTDKAIADFLNRPQHIGPLDYVRSRMNDLVFLTAIQSPQFQPLLELLYDDPSLIDANKYVEPARRTFRAEDIEKFANFCNFITATREGQLDDLCDHLERRIRLKTDDAVEDDIERASILVRQLTQSIVTGLNQYSQSRYGRD